MVKMRRVRIYKKGILFTIGLMLLALIVLALAVLIFHTTQKFEDIVTELAVLDRVYDLSTSIEKSLIDTFYLKSGISISITDNDVSFEETLPNTDYAELSDSLTSFKTSLETDFPNIDLTIGNMEGMPLKIMPDLTVPTQYVSYEHENSWGDIKVLPTGAGIDGYSVSFTINKEVSCIWDQQGGSLDFNLDVDGVATGCVGSEEIGPTTTIQVVDSDNENKVYVTIELGDNNVLSIDPGNGISIRAITTIHMSQPPAGIIADSLSFKVDFEEDLGVYKEREVRII